MKFRTKFSERKRVFSQVGDRCKVLYSLALDENGREVLKKSGMTDLKNEIQSHHDSVCLDMILMRYMQGDESALNKVEGFYADVSNMPVKLNDVLNLAREGKSIFDSLPTDVKEVFGNDYMMFLNRPDLYESAVKKDENVSDRESVETKEEVKTNDE